jgi:hypothetical protein
VFEERGSPTARYSVNPELREVTATAEKRVDRVWFFVPDDLAFGRRVENAKKHVD